MWIPAAAVLTAAAAAWSAGGHLEEDVRVGTSLERVQSAAALRVEGAPGPRLRVVADGRVLHRAGPDASPAALGERTPLHPWRLDGDALFVEVAGLGGPGGWLRLGRQSVRWGRGLLVSPTSVVSPPDLEDPLRFGSPRGSEMARLLVAAGPVTVEALAGHAARPALLPRFEPRDALAAGGDPAAAAIARDPSWTVALRLHDPLPPARLREAPLGVRVAGELPFAGGEGALSWYRGRSPLPEVSRAVLEVDAAGRRLGGDVTFAYPRIQMFGADAGVELPVPWLRAIGLYGEAAWIVPRAMTRTTEALGVERSSSILGEPYPRGVAGVEWAGGTYVALEWSRGFPDELGAGRQRDYLFAVVEHRFLREKLSLRLVAGHCLDDGSRLFAPELAGSLGGGVTAAVGAYGGAGREDSKFAGPLAGDPVAIARVRRSF